MIDQRIEKLAETLVNYSVGVQPGDWVHVRGHVVTLPLLEEVVRQVVQAGGNPSIQMFNDRLQEIVLEEGSDEQLLWTSPLDNLVGDEVDVRIVLMGAENTRALTAIDPRRQQLQQQGNSKIRESFMRRTAEGTHRWVGTLFPCPAYAQEADMSLREYEDFVYGATFADQPDPVQCWQEIHDMQQRLIDWLVGKEQVVVRGPNIDLSLSIAGRSWVNSDGKRNMPSGEIFTGPVEPARQRSGCTLFG